jgi:hypothetical protein
VALQVLVVGVVDCMRAFGDLDGEIEHRLVPRREVGLAIIDGDLIGDERILCADAQDRAVSYDAVGAVVEVATTIISRSALLKPPGFSISAS